MADAPSVPSKDIARIRQVLARELETISEYEELARAAEDGSVRAFFLHLADEEKEHVAEAVFLLGHFDPGQKAQYQKDFSPAHFGAAAAPAAQAQAYLPEGHALPGAPQHILHALPAPPSPGAGQLTVGPLKGRKP